VTKKLLDSNFLNRNTIISLLALSGVVISSSSSFAETCEVLPPAQKHDASNVLTITMNPEGNPIVWANPYFQTLKPYKSVVVKLEPLTSDVGTYPVKIIARYNDDTIFEYGVFPIVPNTGKSYTWGPFPLNQSGKIPRILNVKVQDNYFLTPNTKGFTFKISVLGCND